MSSLNTYTQDNRVHYWNWNFVRTKKKLRGRVTDLGLRVKIRRPFGVRETEMIYISTT